jgi:uncharacterized membrane protein
VENKARAEPPLHGWLGYPVGFVAAIVVMTAAVAAHGTDHPLWTLTVLAGTEAVIAALATLRAGVASAAFCWAVYAGFVVGRGGELALTGASLRAAVVLVAVTVAAFAAATAARLVHARPHASQTIGSRPHSRALVYLVKEGGHAVVDRDLGTVADRAVADRGRHHGTSSPRPR